MGTAWDNPVMWAHYGQKHQGVCIRFDLAAQAQPQQVTYAPDRLTRSSVSGDLSAHGALRLDSAGCVH